VLEKRFAAVAPQLLTSNGTVAGQITVVDGSLYKVKQIISLQATGVGPAQFQVQRIINCNTIFLGPVGSSDIINSRSDVSAYTVALGAFIFAIEQPRPTVPEEQVTRWTYEEEPVVARRVVIVDECGDKFNDSNPLPVAFDGTITIGDVSIVEGGNTMDVNSDGSINVNIVNSIPTTVPGLNIFYQEISSVASGATTPIYTFTAPVGGFRMFKIEVAGENIALYTLVLNGTTIYSKRTFYGDLNTSFIFEDEVYGLKLNGGDVLKVNVLHNKPYTANFETTLMGIDL
jgi:hypothetical protein